MNSDSERVHCPGCDTRLMGNTRRTRGGWDRSPGGDEYFDELHCCSKCNAWWLVTFVDRFAGPLEINIKGPLIDEEVNQQRQRLSS